MSRFIITVLAATLAAVFLQAGPASATNKDAVTAFRMTRLELQDPQVLMPLGFFSYDMTRSVNYFINKQFHEDSSKTTYMDASFLVIFDPMDQWTDEGVVEISQAKCTFESNGRNCHLDTQGKPATVFYTNMRSGTCAGVINRTARWGRVTPVTGPCFFTEQATMGVDIAGINVMLEEAMVSARWNGEPATKITGMLRGFLSQENAENTKMPRWAPIIGGRALADVLDKKVLDFGPDGKTLGYWLYFNFDAYPVNLAE
jgi:hypothetical protein